MFLSQGRKAYNQLTDSRGGTSGKAAMHPPGEQASVDLPRFPASDSIPFTDFFNL